MNLTDLLLGAGLVYSIVFVLFAVGFVVLFVYVARDMLRSKRELDRDWDRARKEIEAGRARHAVRREQFDHTWTSRTTRSPRPAYRRTERTEDGDTTVTTMWASLNGTATPVHSWSSKNDTACDTSSSSSYDSGNSSCDSGSSSGGDF